MRVVAAERSRWWCHAGVAGSSCPVPRNVYPGCWCGPGSSSTTNSGSLLRSVNILTACVDAAVAEPRARSLGPRGGVARAIDAPHAPHALRLSELRRARRGAAGRRSASRGPSLGTGVVETRAAAHVVLTPSPRCSSDARRPPEGAAEARQRQRRRSASRRSWSLSTASTKLRAAAAAVAFAATSPRRTPDATGGSSTLYRHMKAPKLGRRTVPFRGRRTRRTFE